MSRWVLAWPWSDVVVTYQQYNGPFVDSDVTYHLLNLVSKNIFLITGVFVDSRVSSNWFKINRIRSWQFKRVLGKILGLRYQIVTTRSRGDLIVRLGNAISKELRWESSFKGIGMRKQRDEEDQRRKMRQESSSFYFTGCIYSRPLGFNLCRSLMCWATSGS
jgi:hypothetical protein